MRTIAGWGEGTSPGKAAAAATDVIIQDCARPETPRVALPGGPVAKCGPRLTPCADKPAGSQCTLRPTRGRTHGHARDGRHSGIARPAENQRLPDTRRGAVRRGRVPRRLRHTGH